MDYLNVHFPNFQGGGGGVARHSLGFHLGVVGKGRGGGRGS